MLKCDARKLWGKINYINAYSKLRLENSDKYYLYVVSVVKSMMHRLFRANVRYAL